MAKFVIAGYANCPRFAKIELLCDQLSISLPSFAVHKIVKHPSEWNSWLENVCAQNSWSHDKAKPLVWRELLDRGGKGFYIGAFNEFVEFVAGYYGVTYSLSSIDACAIAKENLETKKELMEEEQEALAQITPLIVCITNASSPIAYYFLPRLMSGEVFGQETEIQLKLLDSLDNLENLQGLKMEIEDGGHPLFRGVQIFSDPKLAFQDAKFILSFDEVDSQPARRRSDLLEAYANIFKNYADVLNEIYGGPEEKEEEEEEKEGEADRYQQSVIKFKEGPDELEPEYRREEDGDAEGGTGTNKMTNLDVNKEHEEEGGEEEEPEVTFILAGPGPVTIQAQTLLDWRGKDYRFIKDAEGEEEEEDVGEGGNGIEEGEVKEGEKRRKKKRKLLAEFCRVIPFVGFEETLVKSFLAKKMRVRVDDIADVVVWGVTNLNVHPDLTWARVHSHKSCVYGPEWYSDPILPKIYERMWLEEYTMFMREFMLGHRCGTNLAVQSAKMVERQKPNAKMRKMQEQEFKGMGSTRTKALPHLPYLTYVDSICLFFNNYLRGSDPMRFFSCGVVSDGSYGVPAGLVFSFPCSFVSPRKIKIIGDLKADPSSELSEANPGDQGAASRRGSSASTSDLSPDASAAIARMAAQMKQACQKIGLFPVLPSAESVERMRIDRLDFYRRGWRMAEDEWSLTSLQDADFTRISTAIGLREKTQSKIWPKRKLQEGVEAGVVQGLVG